MATELGLLSLGHPTSLWHLVKCFSDRPNDGMELLRLRGSVGLAPRRELEPVQKLPGSFSSHSSELSAQQLHGDAGAQRRSWWDGMGWDGRAAEGQSRKTLCCLPTGEPWLLGGEAEPRRASSARELASGHVLSPM